MLLDGTGKGAPRRPRPPPAIYRLNQSPPPKVPRGPARGCSEVGWGLRARICGLHALGRKSRPRRGRAALPFQSPQAALAEIQHKAGLKRNQTSPSALADRGVNDPVAAELLTKSKRERLYAELIADFFGPFHDLRSAGPAVEPALHADPVVGYPAGHIHSPPRSASTWRRTSTIFGMPLWMRTSSGRCPA
jgi:hypothetical protein